MIRDGKMMFITMYVDDFLIYTNDPKLKMKLKNYLCTRFKIQGLGEARYCLGITISRNRAKGKLWLDQQRYVEEVIKRFGKADSHPVTTPTEGSIKMDQLMAPKNQWNVKKQPTVVLSSCEAEYMALSRAIQEAMRWNKLRSEIFEDRPITVFYDKPICSNPGQRHWKPVKRILRYLRGTTKARLEYSVDGNILDISIRIEEETWIFRNRQLTISS